MTYRHFTGLIAPFVALAILVGGFGIATSALVAPSTADAAGAQFNTNPQDFPVLETSNYTQNPGCRTCWSSSISGVKGGDVISFVFYYHNTGTEAARNTYLKLIMQPTSGGITANGRVSADNASPVFGTARVSFASGVTNPTLTYVGSEWYKDSTFEPNSPDSLPGGQSGSQVTAAGPGVTVGDVQPDGGTPFAHDGQFVVRFRVNADDTGGGTPTLRVTPDTQSVDVGGTRDYRAFYDADGPGGQSERDVTFNAAWASLNTSIASSLNGGRFRGEREGTATVRASYQGLSDTATLRVDDIGGCDANTNPTLRVDPASASVRVGGTYTYRAFYDPDGLCATQSERDVTGNASWSSLNTSIATSLSRGTFRGDREGTATVRAIYQNTEDTATLRVDDDDTCSSGATLRVDPSRATIDVDEEYDFEAFYDPDGSCSGQSERNVSGSASWSSLNSSVASSLGSGRFRGEREGSATVRASYQGLSDTSILDVDDNGDDRCDDRDAQLRVTPSSATVDVDETKQFRAFYDEDGPDCDDEDEDEVTDSADWSTSNSSIASEEGDGEFRGERQGTVTVRANYRGESDTASLRVEDNGDDDDNDCDGNESIRVIPELGSTNVGGTFTFRALYDPDGPGCSDSSERDVSGSADWSSFNTGVASSLGGGTFRGTAAGTAGIRASFSGISDSASLIVNPSGVVLPPTIFTPPTIITTGGGGGGGVVAGAAVATQGVACLIVTPALDVTELRPGVDFTYTTYYRNDCTFTLNNAMLRVYLPNEADFLQSSNPFFIREGQKFSYPLGPLAPGQQGSVAIRGHMRKDAHLGETVIFTSMIEFVDLQGRTQSTTSYLSAVLGENINKPLSASITDTLGGFLRTPLAWILIVLILIALLIWGLLSRRRPEVVERTSTTVTSTDRHDDPLRGLRNA